MPRLTDKQYLHIYHRLSRLWFHNRGVFAGVSSTEQWQLHDFFQPSKELTNAELQSHRAEITKRRPSLPHQAGRALSKLDAYAIHWATNLHLQRAFATVGRRRRGEQQRVMISPLVVPEPDARKLAKAIILIAKQKLEAERDAAA